MVKFVDESVNSMYLESVVMGFSNNATNAFGDSKNDQCTCNFCSVNLVKTFPSLKLRVSNFGIIIKISESYILYSYHTAIPQHRNLFCTEFDSNYCSLERLLFRSNFGNVQMSLSTTSAIHDFQHKNTWVSIFLAITSTGVIFVAAFC